MIKPTPNQAKHWTLGAALSQWRKAKSPCARHPKPDSHKVDQAAIDDVNWLQNVIVGIRAIRGEMNISPSKQLAIYLANGATEDLRRLNENKQFLQKLASLEEVTWLTPEESAPLSATSLVGDLEIHVPLAGLIDRDAELARLDKEIAKLDKNIQILGGKLNNQKFVENAPKEVVEKEREKLAEVQSAKGKLEEQKGKIAEL